MTTYCTDVDLIQWEPNLLKDAAFASQTLLPNSIRRVSRNYEIRALLPCLGQARHDGA